MAITLNGTTGITTPDLTSEAGLTVDGVSFASGAPANTLVTTSGGNVGVGTSSPSGTFVVAGSDTYPRELQVSTNDQTVTLKAKGKEALTYNGTLNLSADGAGGDIRFEINSTERARIDSSGNLLVGKTARNFAATGVNIQAGGGDCHWTANNNLLVAFNRLSSDGLLVEFAQASTVEGSISVSGTTVSYNGGHLSRWAQTTTAKDESMVKGTVLSNLDEMNVYTDSEGNTVDNEQLNKVKVSDVEGDANVAGVFVNWDYDEAHNVDEINMAMTGDMIIRIAAGTTVARGDLLMSAGDGTAKPQGDDIVRAKTIAKVTSTHVTCTYDDGSYCVPCVLMAC